MENVQVSILCLAYNHEKYIRKCLDGFVMQKDVTFEIIIHDDASTDNTADIIREYEKKYPLLFKPIYQNENQLSKHTSFIKHYMIPLISGKYVALCEGDDYWTDPYKLKKQFDALDSNPDCYMCLHKVEVVNEDGSANGINYPSYELHSGKMTSDQFYEIYNKTRRFHTSCFFLNSEKYMYYRNDPPIFRLVAPVGDDPILLYFSYIGNVYYINNIMSNYRFQSTGSWSSSFCGEDKLKILEKKENYYRRFIAMLKEFSVFSNAKYDNELTFMCDYMKLMESFLKDEKYWYFIKEKKYKQLFRDFTYKDLKKRGLSNKALLKMTIQIFLKLFKPNATLI